MNASLLDSKVIWHDVECGGYDADLSTWLELATGAGGPLLELGAGTGRVARGLASRGFEVVALDSEPELVNELARRAAADGVGIETVCADARELELERDFAAIIAPMQFIHLLGGERGRATVRAAARAHLRSRGLLAAALLADDGAIEGEGTGLLPDVRELDRWVFSSLPLEVSVDDDGIDIHRLRQIVSPGGELSERTASIHLDRLTPETFEREAEAVGFEVRERVEVPPTADHVGSVICVLEAPR